MVSSRTCTFGSRFHSVEMINTFFVHVLSDCTVHGQQQNLHNLGVGNSGT